jgi:probable phosphoglycerate mutase
MALLLHLVRHASHADVGRRLVGRAPGAILGIEGRAQAMRLARFFATGRADVIQSSPRERTMQTADPIAQELALSCDVVPSLDEVDFGEWTGLSFEALEQDTRWREWNTRRGSGRAPGGESMADAQARIVAQIEGLKREGVHRAILVSHAEPIRAALLHYLDRPLDRWSEIEIAPAGISTLAFGRDKVEVVSINERVAE